jgi:hypothetical protein
MAIGDLTLNRTKHTVAAVIDLGDLTAKLTVWYVVAISLTRMRLTRTGSKMDAATLVR